MKMLEHFQIEHVGNVGPRSPENNNRIERLHGTIKEWIRSKGKGLGNHAQELIEGYRLYYNHLRPNMATNNKPPANKNINRLTTIIKEYGNQKPKNNK